ncbi:MAG: tyrosine--tRNA ligase [Candidatus Aenigmatarchaeota archaeon]
MDVDEKIEIIKSNAEEIITEKELRELLETKKTPLAYDGFEPSGLAHIAFGVFRPLLLKEFQKVGIRFKFLLADSFAWINNKMQGDLEKIRKVGEYFIEVWKAAGVENVEYCWALDFFSDREYWKKVIIIAKNTTIKRATRALTIMGRKEGELKEVAQYFYPMMQCADIFHLDVDICQLGLDQRRVNMLARDIASKLGWKKPVVISHHMLMGLEGIKTPEGYDENKSIDIQISSKMSKSKPSGCIFIHDSKEELKRKILAAYCPPKQVEGNPILEYFKYIIFKSFKEIKIEREEKYGGNIEFLSYEELEKSYLSGEIHPLDLKNSAIEYLDRIIAPIREHFEKNKKARELYDFVREQTITR